MRGVTRLPSVGMRPPSICFNQRTPCGVQRTSRFPESSCSVFQSTHPVRSATCCCKVCRIYISSHFNQRTPCGVQALLSVIKCWQPCFNLTHPMRGATAKLIQFKRILVARRMYSFANYVLHILKHSPTYCIGITLYLVLFGAKLPVILCQLVVRTTLMTLL